MKKVILSSVLAATAIGSATSANAQATTTPTQFCSGVGGGGNGALVVTSTGGFVITAFTPKCSSNVFLVGSDNNTYYLVGSGSAKGKNRFAGSTMGGGIASAGSCAATGCSASDAAAAYTLGAIS